VEGRWRAGGGHVEGTWRAGGGPAVQVEGRWRARGGPAVQVEGRWRARGGQVEGLQCRGAAHGPSAAPPPPPPSQPAAASPARPAPAPPPPPPRAAPPPSAAPPAPPAAPPPDPPAARPEPCRSARRGPAAAHCRLRARRGERALRRRGQRRSPCPTPFLPMIRPIPFPSPGPPTRDVALLGDERALERHHLEPLRAVRQAAARLLALHDHRVSADTRADTRVRRRWAQKALSRMRAAGLQARGRAVGAVLTPPALPPCRAAPPTPARIGRPAPGAGLGCAAGPTPGRPRGPGRAPAPTRASPAARCSCILYPVTITSHHLRPAARDPCGAQRSGQPCGRGGGDSAAQRGPPP
jgi:hypothetical protein